MFKKVDFKNNKGQVLRGFVHVPKKFKTAVIFLHGFPSHCQGFTATRIGNALAKKKYLLLRFDFSGTDLSDGDFANKLMSQEVKDIKYAIDFLHRNWEFEQLIVVGHSTGAIDLALYAHKDKRIDKVVLMGAEGDLTQAVNIDFTSIQVKEFWEKGYITYQRPGKWVDRKRLNKAFYDEFFKLDVLKSIKKLRKPLLIVHGEKDEAVPLSHPESIFAAANKPKRLVIVRDADHRFSKREHFDKLVRSIHRFAKEKF